MALNSRIIYRLVSIRVFVVIALMVFLYSGRMPTSLQGFVDLLNRHFLALAVQYYPLSPPHTPITAIHVPDLTFESWQEDIDGAKELLGILNKAQPGSTTLAFITEEPVRLISGRAEKLLGVWEDDRRLNPKEFRDLSKTLVDEREQLLEKLKMDVVIGITARLSRHAAKVHVTASESKYLPYWLLDHKMAMPDYLAPAPINSSLLHYPLPLNDSLSQPLLYTENNDAYLSFLGRFLVAVQSTKAVFDTDLSDTVLLNSAQSNALPPELIWWKNRSLQLGGESIKLGFRADIVPLYGEATGIKAPVVQLTLAATQRLESLAGWIVIGRNESPYLINTVQALAALGDGAYLTIPYYLPLIKLSIVLLLILLVIFLSPRLTFYVSMLICGSLVVLMAAVQLLSPRFTGMWMPMADMIAVVLSVHFFMMLWRVNHLELAGLRVENERWALQAARLNYRQGDFIRAADAVANVSLTRASLKWYYLIASALLSKNDAEKSLPLWVKLHRKVRAFKDVEQQVGNCEKILKERIKKPIMPSDDAIICIDNVFEQLGKYQIGEVIGHGDSGVVYKGFDPVIARELAVKTLNINVFTVDNQEKIKAEFSSEIKTLGKLNHPNIVTVFDVGQEENFLYMAMDFAKGRPLTEYLRIDNLLPVAEVYWIGLKVAEALAFANRHSVMHCELKPSNILYDRETYEVKVTDFGIAKWLDVAQSETGELMGSPFYMAPEQLQARPLSLQTDIFRLGTILYQLLTGTLPFKGKNLLDIQDSILYSKPVSLRVLNPALPTSASRIVNCALKKKTAERFNGAAEMAFALKEALIRDFKTEAKLWGLI